DKADQATLRRHRRGLREVEHAQDVQIILTVAMRLWHLPQFQTGDAFLEERSVKRVGSQFTVRFHPKRDALKAPKRTESLDGAANVPRAHPLQRLPEQHETAPNLRLFLPVTAPRPRADAARPEVNEAA